MEYPLLHWHCCTVWPPGPRAEVKMSGCMLSLLLHCDSAQYGVSTQNTIKTNFPPSLPLCTAICHNGCRALGSEEIPESCMQWSFRAISTMIFIFSTRVKLEKEIMRVWKCCLSTIKTPVGQWGSLHILHERGLSLWQDNRDYSKLSLSMSQCSTFHFIFPHFAPDGGPSSRERGAQL